MTKQNSAIGDASAKYSPPHLRITFLVIIGLTLLSGIAHGVLDGRWVTPKNLIAQGEKLANLPEKCGDWTLIETRELEESAADQLQCYGSKVYVYRHNETSSIVTLAALFGPRGPIAVHTPEICYSSVGTTQIGKRKTETVNLDSGGHRFWSVQFATDGSKTPALDVWYGWSDGGNWVAADNPRFWMTSCLYKLQIAGDTGTDEFSPCKSLLESILPELNRLIE